MLILLSDFHFLSCILLGEDLLILLHIFLVGLRLFRDLHLDSLDFRSLERTLDRLLGQLLRLDDQRLDTRTLKCLFADLLDF